MWNERDMRNGICLFGCRREKAKVLNEQKRVLPWVQNLQQRRGEEGLILMGLHKSNFNRSRP